MRDTSRPDLPLDDAEIALVTYSTKPRGGVVHTLSLAEALLRAGVRVHVVTLGQPGTGFFRPTAVPFTVVPAPPRGETLEERVFASVDALEGGLHAHTLEALASRWLEHTPIAWKSVVGAGQKQIAFAQVELSPAAQFAAQEPDLALRLEMAGVSTARFWVNLQANYDLWKAMQHKQPRVQKIQATPV